jgi:hypothetical protein
MSATQKLLLDQLNIASRSGGRPGQLNQEKVKNSTACIPKLLWLHYPPDHIPRQSFLRQFLATWFPALSTIAALHNTVPARTR